MESRSRVLSWSERPRLVGGSCPGPWTGPDREPDICRALFSSQAVARLGTVGANGPRLVPIVFAVDGDRIVSAVDHKPKTTTRLGRLADIAANPTVTALTDHYDEDWTRLWWVRADGEASVLESGTGHTTAVELLVDKYEQYRGRPPHGPVIEVAVTRWSGWSASPAIQGRAQDQ